MKTEITTREQFLSLFDSTYEAVSFEHNVLQVGREYLPAQAILVLAGAQPSPEYWQWLANELFTMQCEADTDAENSTDESDHPAPLSLCLVSRTVAEHLAAAPRLAGGWTAVHPECAQAVEIAGYEGYLALLPSTWPEARPLTEEQVARIVGALGGAHAGSVANEFAGRLTEGR